MEVPEDAVFSASAQDLLKAHGIEVVRTADQGTRPPAEAKETGPAEEKGARAEERGVPTGPGEISEAEIEEIVTRIMDRLGDLRGAKQGVLPMAGKEPAGERVRDREDGLIVCRCEEVTAGEIRDVLRNGIGTLNGVKRVTRAGMGLCQGQTCEGLVSRIIASELGLPPAEVEPSTARTPLRPVPLSVFAKG